MKRSEVVAAIKEVLVNLSKEEVQKIEDRLKELDVKAQLKMKEVEANE